MTGPLIVALDQDDTTRDALTLELDNRYGRQYGVFVHSSHDDALAHLHDVVHDGADVALVLADHLGGGERLLAAVRPLHPHARRGLLLNWSESRSTPEDIMRVMARRTADYCIGKPMASPDEQFHRAITEFLDDWWRVKGRPFEAICVVGDDRSVRTHEICDLLHRHDLPYGFHPVDSAAGRAALEGLAIEPTTLPVVIVHGSEPLIDPRNVDVAEAVGASTRPGVGTYDVAVVGGGPAGLAAAVYAGSEGLRTALIERTSMGGQAGTSSMIRNYLGFPRGISGAELASRALEQALLFGTEMVYGGDVVALRPDGDLRIIELADGTTVTTRTVVIATGVSYRTLNVPTLEPFKGVGVFYGAAMSEARALTGEHACVAGGGNSAGQAALHLAQFAKRVSIIVRSASLAASMSDYLIDSIEHTPNIDVRYSLEIVAGGGDGHLEWIELRDRSAGAVQQVPTAGLFVLIGADPCTDWLPPSIARDPWGYVETGAHCEGATCGTDNDGCTPAPSYDRSPLMFETTIPGVFAVGDVRRGAVKRVASAAGEGSVCVRLIHDYLSTEP